jgi:hypothetical protein
LKGFAVEVTPKESYAPFSVCNMGDDLSETADDDDKSSLFSHDQRLAQGEENYESYIIRYF